MRLRFRITVWVPLLSLQKGSKERRKTKHDENTEGERGIAATPHLSPAQDLCQLRGTASAGMGEAAGLMPAVASTCPHPRAHSSILREPLHCNGWDLSHDNTSGNWTGIRPHLLTI